MKDLIDGLPFDTKEYLAPSTATFVKMVRHNRDRQPEGKLQYILFSHVPPELIERIVEEEQEVKKLFFCRLTYDMDMDDVGRIIVKLPAEPHYIASREFQGLCMRRR